MGMELALAGDELGTAQVNHLGGDGDSDLLGVLRLNGNADRQVQPVDLFLRKASCSKRARTKAVLRREPRQPR